MKRAILVLCGLVLASPAALAVDPHALYEQACSGCHLPDAGPFARGTLTIRDGRVVSQRSGRDVADLLGQGHGRLTKEDTDALVDQFRAILGSGGLFDGKCRICHDSGATFARRTLTIRDGVLVGRYSGRPVAPFLKAHGRLSDDEIPIILSMLERQIASADE